MTLRRYPFFYACRFFFPLLLCAASYPAGATDLAEVRLLAQTGASHLALHVLDMHQPDSKKDFAAWEEWEHERMQLYKQQADWPAILRRTREIPAPATQAFRLWANNERAQALLQTGDGIGARQLLRDLIWQADTAGISAEMLANWRQLVILSYVQEGKSEDAYTATLRYHQDYGEQSIDDVLLRARILLLSGRTAEAVTIVEQHKQEHRANALLLLAQLRGNLRPAAKILQAVLRLIRDKTTPEDVKINLWAIAAEAAQRTGSRATIANALEHVIVNRTALQFSRELLEVNSDTLWNAYIDLAIHKANQQQLLIGQDEAWYQNAQALDAKRPVIARALYAFLVQRGQSQEIRAKSAEAFTALAVKRKHGHVLLSELFLSSRHFKQREQIPLAVRFQLVDIALAASDIDLASEIMATIKQPPQGADQFMWRLRRARILVLGTQPQAGAEALSALLETQQQMPAEQLDRLLQVVFDLQAAKQHEQSVRLFRKVMQKTDDTKVQREIFYWMAESRKAQEHYNDAAYLYLKSAMHPVPEAGADPWGQTARYQAAGALAKAGLYDDAKELFRKLLDVTEESTRRAAIQREIQRLWALQ